jgi:hypothetical protein
MLHSRRLSAAGSLEASRSSPVQRVKPAAEEWTAWWGGILARGQPSATALRYRADKILDLVDHPVELLDAGMAVDEACEVRTYPLPEPRLMYVFRSCYLRTSLALVSNLMTGR